MIAIACAIVIVLCVVPLSPAIVGDGLDWSWVEALHVAFARHLQFGSDIAFSYGPLGFAHARAYWPGLFALTFAYWAVVAGALIAMHRAMPLPSGGATIAAWIAFTVCVVMAGMSASDTIILAFYLVLVWRALASEPGPAGAAIPSAIGAVIALSKLTFLVAGTVSVLAASAILLLRDRRLPALAGVLAFAIVVPLAWVGAHQDLGGLPAYLATGWQIVHGYDAAMALPGAPFEPLAFIALAAIVFVMPVRRMILSRDARLALAVGASLVLLAIAYKQAFTRHDSHAVIAFAFLAFEAAVLAFHARASSGRRGIAAASVLVALACAGTVASARTHLGLGAGYLVEQAVLIPARALASAGQWIAGTHPAPARHAAALEAIRRAHPLPALGGSVDAYSNDLAPVFAYGLDWHPRPVFQSYSAYTPELAAMNASHVTGASAPDHLLFSIEPIDARLPALEDGASWIPIVQRYTPRTQGAMLVLDRDGARKAELRTRPLGRLRAAGWLRLPDAAGAIVTASIRLHAAASNRLASFVFGPPLYFIQLRLAGVEGTRLFRFVPGAAQEPFVISPLVANTADFAQLFNRTPGGTTGHEVREMRIVDSAAREVEFEVELAAVDLARDAAVTRAR